MTVKRHRTHYDVTAENRTDAAMNAVERNMKKVDGAAATMGRTFRAVLGATAAITIGREFARAAIEAEKSQNRLTAVLRATGGVAGVTRREIEAMADSLASSTMFDDEGIRDAAAQLAKFGNVQSDVFREGLRLSTDLASFMGTDVAAAAHMVGRALQSPSEGVQQLEERFGKLTDAQRRNIESLVAQGRAVEAQNAVLGLLQEKIGGTAELMNTGLTKATTDLTKAYDDLVESIGKSDRAQGIAESFFNSITQSMKDIREIVDHGDWVEKTLAILAFAGGWRGFKLSRKPEIDDSANYDARDWMLRRGSMRTPTLGGRNKDEAAAAKAAKRAADLQEQLDVQAAFRSQQAADREAEFLSNLDKQLERKTEILAIDDATVRTAEQIAQRMQMAADQEARFTDPLKLEQMLEGLKSVDQAAMDLGFTFSSAFERAVLEGEKLRDVLSGLAKDVARVVLRTAVTEPMAKAVAGALGGMFGGMGASYTGNVPAFAMGTDSVPRTGLALVHQGEQIIPAGQRGGGVNVHISMPFSANTPAAVRDAVLAAAPMLTQAATRGVMEAKARGR